jgi:hypothetical protein
MILAFLCLTANATFVAAYSSPSFSAHCLPLVP